jgi:acetyl esterase/lipase
MGQTGESWCTPLFQGIERDRFLVACAILPAPKENPNPFEPRARVSTATFIPPVCEWKAKMNHRLKITPPCLSVQLAVSSGPVALAAPQDTAQQASTSCPTPLAGGPAMDGAGPPAGAAAPIVIVAKTIAPVDSSTNTVISPDIADQITGGKAVIHTIRDAVFDEPALLDGTAKKLAMDIQIPEGSEPKPLVVYIPGGGFVRASKESAINLRTFVAEAGFVVASIQYRTLSDGASYRDSIADVKSAIRYLRAHADEYAIDPGEVAVWGESAGGYLAAMIGVTGDIKSFDVGDNLDQSSAVQAVVDKFGASDMSKIAADFNSETQKAYSSPRNTLALYSNGLVSSKSVLDDPTAATTANPLTYINAAAHPSCSSMAARMGSFRRARRFFCTTL